MPRSNDLAWPRCICGHIAQEHNQKLGKEPHNYGCDCCGCIAYSFPAKTPTEYRRALGLQRQRIMEELTLREKKYSKGLPIYRWCNDVEAWISVWRPAGMNVPWSLLVYRGDLK